MIICKISSCVQEAIEDVAALNPEYTEARINPESFIYFLRGLRTNTKLFCEWKDKKAKILHFFTGAVDIYIQIDSFVKTQTVYFTNPGNGDVIEVELSG